MQIRKKRHIDDILQRISSSDTKGKLWNIAQHIGMLTCRDNSLSRTIISSKLSQTTSSNGKTHNKMVNETMIKDGSAFATKDLKPGEIFLSLSLIVEGPGCMKNPVCLGCLNPVSEVKRRQLDSILDFFFFFAFTEQYIWTLSLSQV